MIQQRQSFPLSPLFFFILFVLFIVTIVLACAVDDCIIRIVIHCDEFCSTGGGIHISNSSSNIVEITSAVAGVHFIRP